jgi:hypothetical protein
VAQVNICQSNQSLEITNITSVMITSLENNLEFINPRNINTEASHPNNDDNHMSNWFEPSLAADGDRAQEELVYSSSIIIYMKRGGEE